MERGRPTDILAVEQFGVDVPERVQD